MRRAALDIGSNSILLLVADIAGSHLDPVHERVWYPRLAQGMATSGQLHEENMAAAVDDIAAARDVARRWEASDLVVAATAAVRQAANGPAFVERVGRELGLEILVLTGELEAELTWRGGVSHLPRSEEAICTLDVGGGSSECAVGRGERVESALSAPIGVVNLTDRFGISPGEFPLALELARHKLAPLAALARGGRLVGIGGTITTLASVELGSAGYDPDEIATVRFTQVDLERYIHLFRSSSMEEIRTLPGMEPRRADVIEAGATLFHTFMELAEVDTITVSPRGLRHGLLLVEGAKQSL